MVRPTPFIVVVVDVERLRGPRAAAGGNGRLHWVFLLKFTFITAIPVIVRDFAMKFGATAFF
jgi:hypothetical protein